MTFMDNIKILKDIKLYNNERKKFNDNFNEFTNINKLTPGEANALRHIGASAYFGSNYGPNTSNGLGTLNEMRFGNTGSAQGDYKTDLYNNHVGRLMGLEYSNLTPQEALIKGIDLIRNTNKAAVTNNDKRALNYEYPATVFQKALGFLKN